MNAIKTEISQIQQELSLLADPVRAAGEKKYLKSPMKHYGVTVPSIRRIAQIWLKKHSLPIDQIIEFAQSLWQGEYHEERMLAIFLLVYRVKELTFAHYSLIEQMVKESTGWAQLDMVAAWLCGQLYSLDRNLMTSVLNNWVKDQNFWVRRAAILTFLGPARISKSDFKAFTKFAVPLLKEKEFFIRKAIGWVLREVSKKHPQWVLSFVSQHRPQMSGLTYREATRKLPTDMQP